MESAKNPPRKGPIAHPVYHVWLYIPIYSPLSLSFAISAINAGVTAPNAAHIPPSSISIGNMCKIDREREYKRNIKEKEAIVRIIIGFRPTLSDNLPKIGAKMIPDSELAVYTMPICVMDMPNSHR